MEGESKPEREMRHVAQLLKSGVFPFVGEAKPVMPDPPDIELIAANARIAIEVTELYQDPQTRPFGFGGRPRQAFESEVSGLLAEVERRWKAAGVGHMHAVVLVVEPFDLRGTQREKMCQWLLEQLKRGFSSCKSPGRNTFGRRGYGIIKIDIFRSPQLMDSQVIRADLGFPMAMKVDLLQTRVLTKQSRLPRYAAHYDQAHLLLVMASRNLSGMFREGKQSEELVVSSSFHGVWLLDERTGAVRQVSAPTVPTDVSNQ